MFVRNEPCVPGTIVVLRLALFPSTPIVTQLDIADHIDPHAESTPGKTLSWMLEPSVPHRVVMNA